jgi:peptidoglycan-associated lipoprotein
LVTTKKKGVGMKRSIITITTVTTMMMLVGCGQPAPEGTVVGQGRTGADIVGDTVDIDEGRYNAGNGAYAGMNSSGDGFQSIYFGFDRYDIAPDMENIIVYDADHAKKRQGKIRIEGNCDEFGTDEYNYALGLKRAKAVKDALAAQGVDTTRMLLVSYGESNPVCTDQSERCYRKNRRVDLRIVR